MAGDSGLHAELEIGPREGLGVECGDRMMFFAFEREGEIQSRWRELVRGFNASEMRSKKTPDRSKHDHPHLEGLERLSPSQGVSMLLHLRSEILGSSEL